MLHWSIFLVLLTSTTGAVPVQNPPTDQLVRFEILRNETLLLLTWANNQTKEVWLMQEDSECIYRGTIREDPGSSVLVTGCWGQERGLQIQSSRFGDTLATGDIHGGLEAAKRQVLQDDDVRPDEGRGQGTDHRRRKRESVENPDFFNFQPSQHPVSALDLPRNAKFVLPLKIFLAPSWITKFGSFQAGKSAAKQIVGHVRDWFTHSSLNTKLYLTVPGGYIIKTDIEKAPSRGNIASVTNSLPTPPKGTLNVYLTASRDSNTLGIAYMNAVCDPDKAASLSLWNRNTIATAQTVAHEIGHNLGFCHDFDTCSKGPGRERTSTCGPGKERTGPTNNLMNYGTPVNSWSTCSNTDFKNYYETLTTGHNQDFCLQTVTSQICPAPTDHSCPMDNVRVHETLPAERKNCYYQRCDAYSADLSTMAMGEIGSGGLCNSITFEIPQTSYCCDLEEYFTDPHGNSRPQQQIRFPRCDDMSAVP